MVRKSHGTMVLALLLAVLLVGCQSGTQPTESVEGTQEGAAGKGGGKAPAAEKVSVTIPVGTELTVRLDATIDTGSTPAGAEFSGTLANALVVSGTEVASVGSSVTGKVTKVVSSGRLKTPAELSLVLTSLTVKGGEKVAIETNTWSTKGESHKKRNLTMIGGGAGAGALIGAIAGGKKGAAIGGAVGAGAGTGAAAYTGKKEIVLAAETALNFKLASAVVVTLQK